MWDLLGQDIRYGVRVMGRAPGVTAAAILTMAVAVGANAAVFALVHAVLLSPLPFPRPGSTGRALSINGLMEDIVARALAPARSSAWLLGSFAFVALVLAVLGVFGVLSYSVGLRSPSAWRSARRRAPSPVCCSSRR